MAPVREPFLLCSGSFPEAFGVVPANVLLYQEYHWKTGECGFAPSFSCFFIFGSSTGASEAAAQGINQR